ncbi:MAG: dihydrodipicolinate synthase family protein [Salinibacter sp.]
MAASSLPNGVIVASVTPLDADATPDGRALARHLQFVFEQGCDGALLFGTTGEGLSFTVEERRSALDAVLDAGVPPRRLLVGTGAFPLPDVIELTRHAADRGVGGVLVVPPFHFRDVTDDGLVRTYDQIVQGAGRETLRLYFYHYPELTGVPVSFPVIEQLRDRYPNQIAGIKDSSDEWDHHDALCSSFPDLQIFAGSERHLTPFLRAGGAGCISATVNITAPVARQAVRDWQNDATVASAQSTLTELRTRLSQFPTIPALKQLLAWRQERPGWTRVRPPLAPLDADEEERLASLHDSLWDEVEAARAS